MNPLETCVIQCPYCWEHFEVEVDCTEASQEYVEDCQVCCQPLVLAISVGEDGQIDVDVSRGND